jgi:hypothetical protein
LVTRWFSKQMVYPAFLQTFNALRLGLATVTRLREDKLRRIGASVTLCYRAIPQTNPQRTADRRAGRANPHLPGERG